MASSGKKKTTMAKLMRESRLRERRQDKKARKDARKQAALDGVSLQDPGVPLEDGETPDDAPDDAPDSSAPQSTVAEIS
jgi:hypothetical protein